MCSQPGLLCMINCTSTWYVTGSFYSILECFGHAKSFEAIVKFHDALQYPDDIKQFGMTTNTSTGPKELFNKDSKRAAKGTNFRQNTPQASFHAAHACCICCAELTMTGCSLPISFSYIKLWSKFLKEQSPVDQDMA